LTAQYRIGINPLEGGKNPGDRTTGGPVFSLQFASFRKTMSTLLRIDSSSRTEGSHSRALADKVQEHWLASHPGGTVVVRDLVATPVPHISNLTIGGFYTPADARSPELQEAVAFSDELIAELLAADDVLISVPMYNLGVPSRFKAYIDHVVRVGKTFAIEPGVGYVGLVRGKKGYVAASHGGAGYGDGPMSSYDFLIPYVRTVLGFIGLTDVTFFSLEGAAANPEAFAATKEKAHADIVTTFAG